MTMIKVTNLSLDVSINIDGEEFVIMGDADLVSDETILKLAAREQVEGWTYHNADGSFPQR